jgi:hypothetical protein
VAKGDIKISKLRNLPTTDNITSLGLIDVTSSSSYPDGYAIISKDAPNHRLYILNRSSTDTPDNDQFVPSNVSGVVWERIMGTQIATNDLRGTFDITTNPAQYPKGLASSAVNATQVGNGSGVGPTIQGGDFWYVIDNSAGTNTIGPGAKPITTNNAIILALVDNATNADSDWIILEASAGSDLAPHIASLRTLGTGAQQAAAGNDPRLSDARVPLAHAPAHKHGGADEIATATPAANEIPKADGTGKLDAWITGASESAAGKIEIATAAERDAETDDSRAITPLKLATSPRLPTQTENDALQGTSGTPSDVNRFVTDVDPRLTNARTPVGTALTSGQFWVGSAGNVAAAVVASGDLTLSNTGVFTIPVSFITGRTAIAADGADYILVSDTSDSGTFKKVLISSLPTGSGTSSLTNGFLFVGNASNIATGVALSGDATITNTGILTVGANKISNSKLRLSTGLSIMGRSAATNGEVGDIVATAEGQVLQVKAGVLVFDSIAGGSPYPITTKGDLWTYSTVQARLPVGANGTILTADSAETTGIKWSNVFTGTGAYTDDGGISIVSFDIDGFSLDSDDGSSNANVNFGWNGMTIDNNGETLRVAADGTGQQIVHKYPTYDETVLSFPENSTGSTKIIYIPAKTGIMSIIEPIVTLTDASTITWNALTQGKSVKVTLGSNRTLSSITGAPVNGETYTIDIIQDATGGRTLTWNSVYKFPAGFDTGLNSAANAHTTFGFRYDAVAARMEYIFGGKLGAGVVGGYVSKAGDLMTGELNFAEDTGIVIDGISTGGCFVTVGNTPFSQQGVLVGVDAFQNEDYVSISYSNILIAGPSISGKFVQIDLNSIAFNRGVNDWILNFPIVDFTIGHKTVQALDQSGNLLVATTTSYAHDSAANTAGVPVGGAYNSNGVLRMRTGSSTDTLTTVFGAVAKAGDTMTGELIINGDSVSGLQVHDVANDQHVYFQNGQMILQEYDGDGVNTMRYTNGGIVYFPGNGYYTSVGFTPTELSHKSIVFPNQSGTVVLSTGGTMTGDLLFENGNRFGFDNGIASAYFQVGYDDSLGPGLEYAYLNLNGDIISTASVLANNGFQARGYGYAPIPSGTSTDMTLTHNGLRFNKYVSGGISHTAIGIENEFTHQSLSFYNSTSNYWSRVTFTSPVVSNKTMNFLEQSGNIMVASTTSYGSDSSASSGGVPLGGAYNNNGILRIRTGTGSSFSTSNLNAIGAVGKTGQSDMTGVYTITGTSALINVTDTVLGSTLVSPGKLHLIYNADDSYVYSSVGEEATPYFTMGINTTGKSVKLDLDSLTFYEMAGTSITLTRQVSMPTGDWVATILGQSGNVMVASTTSYANDAAAAAAGVPVGGAYHTSGALKMRLV